MSLAQFRMKNVPCIQRQFPHAQKILSELEGPQKNLFSSSLEGLLWSSQFHEFPKHSYSQHSGSSRQRFMLQLQKVSLILDIRSRQSGQETFHIYNQKEDQKNKKIFVEFVEGGFRSNLHMYVCQCAMRLKIYLPFIQFATLLSPVLSSLLSLRNKIFYTNNLQSLYFTNLHNKKKLCSPSPMMR